jgi:membrane-associated phospholipid phosphatase
MQAGTSSRLRVGARRVPTRIGALLPHGPRDFWLQFAVFWTFNLAYELTRGLVDGSREEALATGRRVMEAQRDLGILWELDVQRWAYDAPAVVMDVANLTYFNCQFTISFGLLLWIYLRRNHAFYFVRNTIMFANFIGLIGYVAFPTAPPRMYPEVGFVDSLLDASVNHESWLIRTLSNPYAAMPSLHTAYALILGTAAVLVTRHLVIRLIWAGYPALVLFSIVATANHFILDAVAGAVVALFATLLSVAVARGVAPRRGRAPRGPLTPRLAASPTGD